MLIARLLIRFALATMAGQCCAQTSPTVTQGQIAARAQAADHLKALIESSPRLALVQHDVPIQIPAGQELGQISWFTRDPKSGALWLIQRGGKADPAIAVDPQGHVLHSFGKGLYVIPHAIRLDPEGNVWTVDAGSSRVIKYSPQGKELLRIEVGGQPDLRSPFKGATDIAFAPHGRIFIADGYGNARMLEYTPQGRMVREWGSAGTGPGEFHLPHSIVVDDDNILYVADRENGRIEKFSLDGRFLGEIAGLGRTYSLALGPNGSLWAGTAPLNAPTGAPGWIVQLDRKTGKILGYVPVAEEGGLHTVEDDGHGHPMTNISNHIVIFEP